MNPTGKLDRPTFDRSRRASCRRDFTFASEPYKMGHEFPHASLGVPEHRLRNLYAARFIDFVDPDHVFPVPLHRRDGKVDSTPKSMTPAAPSKPTPNPKKTPKPAKPKGNETARQ